MDEKELRTEFMSILGENHPGLTFDEYRNSCIFLLFYNYLCLKYDDQVDENYKLQMMVRLAIRGKLQMDSFLKFIGNASPFFHMVCPEFCLTEFTFYKHLSEVETLEKQKSYARFLRKLIKKMYVWNEKENVLLHYPACFEGLIEEFSRMKKETGIPQSILQLYQIFNEENRLKKEQRVFQPEFRYGLLLRSLLEECEKPFMCGYESQEEYVELISLLSFMKGIPYQGQYFASNKEWIKERCHFGPVDTVCIYQPEGVEAGTYLSSEEEYDEIKGFMNLRTKGEFPFILSAFPLLKENGDIMAILPSAILYREGRETQVRKYLVETLNCLDTIILLPDSAFPSLGQQEVFLYIKKDRQKEDVMFFDCSEVEDFNKDILKDIRKAWRGRKTLPGFCNRVDLDEIVANDYNLNLPRYIKKPTGLQAIDINEKKRRIEEINQELREIDARIEMYRRDLELDAFVK